MSDDELVEQAQTTYDALDAMGLYAQVAATIERFRALMVEEE